MIVLGMESSQTSVAHSLAQEADQLVMLESDFLSPHFSKKPDPSTITLGRDPFEVGGEHADTWLEAATPEDLQRLVDELPWIPRDVDRELLAKARQTVARELSPDQLRALRDGFMTRIRQQNA